MEGGSCCSLIYLLNATILAFIYVPATFLLNLLSTSLFFLWQSTERTGCSQQVSESKAGVTAGQAVSSLMGTVPLILNTRKKLGDRVL